MFGRIVLVLCCIKLARVKGFFVYSNERIISTKSWEICSSHKTNTFSECKKLTVWSGMGSNLRTDTASYPTLLESSSAPMWGSLISHRKIMICSWRRRYMVWLDICRVKQVWLGGTCILPPLLPASLCTTNRIMWLTAGHTQYPDPWTWSQQFPPKHRQQFTYFHGFTGTVVAQWLRCCATNRKVAGSIPACVILPLALWPWRRLSL